jgi:hypothetical protein
MAYPPTLCERKAVAPMASYHSVLTSIRKEVQDYLRATEHLISALASGDNPRLTEMERDTVEFYTKELAELVVAMPSARPFPVDLDRSAAP